MNSTKLWSNVLGVTAIVLPVWAYWAHVQWLGFPDGHQTEYEQGQRTLFHVYWPLSLALSARFFYLGVLSVRWDVKRSLWPSVIGYLVLVITLLAVHHSLSGSLDHGGGG